MVHGILCILIAKKWVYWLRFLSSKTCKCLSFESKCVYLTSLSLAFVNSFVWQIISCVDCVRSKLIILGRWIGNKTVIIVVKRPTNSPTFTLHILWILFGVIINTVRAKVYVWRCSREVLPSIYLNSALLICFSTFYASYIYQQAIRILASNFRIVSIRCRWFNMFAFHLK